MVPVEPVTVMVIVPPKVAGFGPEMTVVGFAFVLPGRTEGLAGARACPNRSVSPPGELQGIGPSANAGKEMALRESPEVARFGPLGGPHREPGEFAFAA